MPIKTYNCPNPDDFAAGDAYLINGEWYVDVEDREYRLEGKLIRDDLEDTLVDIARTHDPRGRWEAEALFDLADMLKARR